MAHNTGPNNPNQAPRPQFNLMVRIGMWLTVISAALWIGGVVIKSIETYLPYALGLGILIMAIGMFMQARKSKVA